MGITSEASLQRSVRIQARVIWALLMREIITRYGRHNIGFMWMFVEPIIFTLGVAALWSFAGLRHGSSIPIVAFAVTGYSAVLLWRNMPGRCVGAVEPNLGRPRDDLDRLGKCRIGGPPIPVEGDMEQPERCDRVG